tara:strand:+ start:2506 stop:3651 length:1146 start_codon:yes stop_codon:yes gene_type:complete
MADEMGEIFAEQLGGEVVSNNDQEKMTQPTVVDLTTPEPVQESKPTQETVESSTTETLKEAPVESQNNVDRSLNTESNEQSQQEDVSQNSAEENRQEFLKFVNDQFSTSFDSIDSFKDAVSKQEKTSFANEQIEKMNTFVSETGRTIGDYIRTQTVDYSKMSNEDVMRISLKQNNPDLTMDEVNVLVESKYKTNKDKNSEADQTLGKIELKKDVSQARKDLINTQEKYRMPVNNEGNNTEQAESIRKNWVESMSNEASDVESISFNINDSGEEFTYALTEEHRNSLVESNSQLNNYFDKYVNEEGGWNFDKLNTDMIVLNNFEDIIRSVANQYRSKGTEQVVKDIKNPSFNNDNRVATNQNKSMLDQLDDQINGIGSMWNR